MTGDTRYVVVSPDGETFFDVNEATIVAVPPTVLDEQDEIERWVNSPEAAENHLVGVLGIHDDYPMVVGPIPQMREILFNKLRARKV